MWKCPYSIDSLVRFEILSWKSFPHGFEGTAPQCCYCTTWRQSESWTFVDGFLSFCELVRSLPLVLLKFHHNILIVCLFLSNMQGIWIWKLIHSVLDNFHDLKNNFPASVFSSWNSFIIQMSNVFNWFYQFPFF